MIFWMTEIKTNIISGDIIFKTYQVLETLDRQQFNSRLAKISFIIRCIQVNASFLRHYRWIWRLSNLKYNCPPPHRRDFPVAKVRMHSFGLRTDSLLNFSFIATDGSISANRVHMQLAILLSCQTQDCWAEENNTCCVD